MKLVNRKSRWGKHTGHTAELWWNGLLARYEDMPAHLKGRKHE